MQAWSWRPDPPNHSANDGHGERSNGMMTGRRSPIFISTGRETMFPSSNRPPRGWPVEGRNLAVQAPHGLRSQLP